MNKKSVNIIAIFLLTILSIIVMWQEAKFGISGANNWKRLALIPTLLLAQVSKSTLRIAFVLLVIYAIYSLTALTFGSMKIAFLVSAFETNSNESIEYLKTFPALNYGVMLLFLLASILFYKTASIISVPHFYYKVIAIALFFIFTVFSWPGTLIRQTIVMGKEYYEARQILINSINQLDSWKVETTPKYNQYDNYVLVIGESVRKDYLSVYGYSHPTTPWLDKVNGKFVDGYISMGANTVSSLSRTLAQSVGDGMEFIPENNIMTLANKGPYFTSWISNQGKIGRYDTSTSTVAIRAKNTFFMNKGDYSGQNLDDKDMLVHLDQVLKLKSEDPKLTVLHMLGSHPDTCERLHDFPNNFNLEQGERFNCYLATIEKTDDFLRQVAEALSKQGSYSLMYFSDHGMSVESDMVRVDGKIKNAYETPLIVLNSDDEDHIVIKKTISGYNFTDIFANWLGLSIDNETKLYDLSHISNIPEPKTVLANNTGKMINPMVLPEQPVLE